MESVVDEVLGDEVPWMKSGRPRGLGGSTRTAAGHRRRRHGSGRGRGEQEEEQEEAEKEEEEGAGMKCYQQ